MPSTLEAYHTHDEALRGYYEHIREKEQLARIALERTQNEFYPSVNGHEQSERLTQPHEYNGFGD